MYAVTDLHFPARGIFLAAAVDDLQRSDSLFAAIRDLAGGHMQPRQMTR